MSNNLILPTLQVSVRASETGSLTAFNNVTPNTSRGRLTAIRIA